MIIFNRFVDRVNEMAKDENNPQSVGVLVVIKIPEKNTHAKVCMEMM